MSLSLAISGSSDELPAQIAPRVAILEIEDGVLYCDLRFGRRLVDNYDPRQQSWHIQHPFHLL